VNSDTSGGEVTPGSEKTSHLPNGAMIVSVSSSVFTRTVSDFVDDAMRASIENADALDDSCGFGGEVGRLATRTSSMVTTPEDVVAQRRGLASDGRGGMAYPSVQQVGRSASAGDGVCALRLVRSHSDVSSSVQWFTAGGRIDADSYNGHPVSEQGTWQMFSLANEQQQHWFLARLSGCCQTARHSDAARAERRADWSRRCRADDTEPRLPACRGRALTVGRRLIGHFDLIVFNTRLHLIKCHCAVAVHLTF